MEFKGTKGKWDACCKLNKPHFVFANDGYITICSFNQKQDSGNDMSITEMQANAKLIESAPEMFEMLKQAKTTICRLRLSMSVHPDCEENSEFADYVDLADEKEKQIKQLLTKITN